MNTIVIGTINHSDIGVIGTNLAIVWGPHFVPEGIDLQGPRDSSDFGMRLPSGRPISEIRAAAHLAHQMGQKFFPFWVG